MSLAVDFPTQLYPTRSRPDNAEPAMTARLHGPAPATGPTIRPVRAKHASRRWLRIVALIVMIGLAAVACGDGGTTEAERPADDDLEPEVAPQPTPTPDPALATPVPATDVTYTVVGGDTPGGIAERFGISLDDLLEANELGIDAVLQVGDTLIVPGVTPDPPPEVDPVTGNTTYVVAPGDTLGAIATRLGVTLQDVLDASGLTVDSVLQVGQEITVPAGGSAVAEETAPSVPASGTSYVVASGDTLGGIASQFGITIDALMDANGLTVDSVLEVGRTLTIPGG